MNCPEGLYILSDVIQLGAECEIIKTIKKRKFYTINKCKITYNDNIFICKLKYYNTGGATFINILTEQEEIPTEEENTLIRALSSCAEKTREYPEDSAIYKRNIARGIYFIVRILIFATFPLDLLLILSQGIIPYILLPLITISALALQKEICKKISALYAGAIAPR